MAYTTTPTDNETIANLPGDIREVTMVVTRAITDHTEATSGAHDASAIGYGTGTVETALNMAAGHEADQSNPHNVTAAQAGAASSDHNHDTIYATISSTPSVNIVGFRLTYSAAAPNNPQNNKELWIDTTDKVIKIYESDAWVTLGAAYL